MATTKLIVQPDDGIAPIVNSIRRAKNSIELTIFRLDSQEMIEALESAVARGVAVRVILGASASRARQSHLRSLEWRLLDAGVTVSHASGDFPRYHGKLMIIDNAILHVYGFNCTKLDLHSRSLGIVTTEQQAVHQAIKLFEADCAHRPYPSGPNGLVVSPENALEQLETFVRGARRELLIYDLKLSDRRIIRLLQERIRAGVDVRVIGRTAKHSKLRVAKLHGQRMHLRAIVRDGSAAFVGSQSLRRAELDARREVGIFVYDAAVVRQIRDTFESDWPLPPHEHKVDQPAQTVRPTQ